MSTHSPRPSGRALDVVYVNHQSAGLLRRSIATLLETAPADLSLAITVVDNTGTEAERAELAALEGVARVLEAPGNVGFSKACNLGAREGRADTLLFLNPDTECLPGMVEGLLSALRERGGRAIVGPRQVADREGRFSISPMRGSILFGEVHDLLYDRGWVSGRSLAYLRERNLILQQVTPRFVEELRRSGCRHAQVGIESGSVEVRREFLNKHITEEEIHRMIALLHEHGIVVKLFALLGVPGETPRRLVESLKGFAAYGAEMVQVQVWIAHEGSDLVEMDREAAAVALRHYDPGADRKAWRLKFHFRWYHRYMALYRYLAFWGGQHPVRARILRALVTASLLFKWTPDILMVRDWDGRPRWPRWFAWLPKLPGIRRLALGRDADAILADIRSLEERLAADYVAPPDIEAPEMDGWRAEARLDRRLDCLRHAPETMALPEAG